MTDLIHVQSEVNYLPFNSPCAVAPNFLYHITTLFLYFMRIKTVIMMLTMLTCAAMNTMYAFVTLCFRQTVSG